MNDIKVPFMPIEKFDADKFLDRLSNESNSIDRESSQFRRDDTPEGMELILEGMGMKKYAKLFREENVSLDTFMHLNDGDLEEIGIVDPNDRKMIAMNLGGNAATPKEFIVSENHDHDAVIARNVKNQLTLISSYCCYIDLKMKSNKLTDYRIGWTEKASTFLREFTQAALTQSIIMSNFLYDENKSDHLIGLALKKNNLELPEWMKKHLKNQRKMNISVPRLIIKAGLTSLVIFTGIYIFRRLHARP